MTEHMSVSDSGSEYSYTKAVDDGGIRGYVEYHRGSVNRISLPDGEIARNAAAGHIMNKFKRDCDFTDVDFTDTDFESRGGPY